MKSIFILLDSIITIYLWIIIINAVLSWLVAFKILNTQNRFVFAVLDVTYKMTDPALNKIRSYLIGKGINDNFINDTVNKIKDENSDQDFFSAIKICKKKRIGPARKDDNRPLFYKKDISLLARNGFDFETSKKVMDIEKEDYIRIIKLL